jgi:hypothetical protein
MKPYPSIPKKSSGEATKFWFFDKLDGSNIRAEWTSKKGFNKFGTRTRLLGSDQGVLFKAESLIKEKEEKFNFYFSRFNKAFGKIDKVTAYFEFWGQNSFAGNHIDTDKHVVSLIDIDLAGHGLIDPAEFDDMFIRSELFDCPKLLYVGPITQDFVNEVKNGTLKDMTFEGVVGKARRNKRFEQPNMFKIKNEAWIAKVKSSFDPKLWEALL